MHDKPAFRIETESQADYAIRLRDFTKSEMKELRENNPDKRIENSETYNSLIEWYVDLDFAIKTWYTEQEIKSKTNA